MPDLSCEISDHIATVTLTSKTMRAAFFTECGQMFRDLSTRDDLRAVIVRAAHEKAFTYGLDLASAFTELGPFLQGGLAGKRAALHRKIRDWQADITAVAECPVPVIAAVHGWCIGGGLNLVSACDIRLCSADARFSLRETRVAIVADLGSLQRLPHIIGQGHTRELAYTGKDIDAERARAIGLVNDIYPDRAALDQGARALAQEIASNPPLTVRGVKQVLDYGQDKSVAAGLAYVAAWNAAFLASKDIAEAMTAFVGKRPPAFTGE